MKTISVQNSAIQYHDMQQVNFLVELILKKNGIRGKPLKKCQDIVGNRIQLTTTLSLKNRSTHRGTQSLNPRRARSTDVFQRVVS